MNRFTISAAALAATLSTAALAQTADVGVDATAGVGGGAAAGTAADMTMDLGQIAASLQGGSELSADWATELAGLSADAQIEIVTLAELKGAAAENSAALDQVIADAQPDVTAAQAAIEANANLTAALEAESFAAEDVVAVMVEGDSQVTLIVDDAS